MTELFDGTGAASQMQAARAHLKSCACCERVWREWSHTRSLLRAVPAPDAPTALQERVLLSCRLLPSQDASAQSALENEIAFEELARYINAPEAEYSLAAAASPLAGFFEDAPVPADLKNRILQLTSQAEVKRAKTLVLPSLSLLPIRQSWSEMAREWSLPRAGRWGFALAVPAAAAWVLMAAPPADLTIAPSKTPQSTPVAVTTFPKNLLPKIAGEAPILKPAPKVALAPRPEAPTSALPAVSIHEERPVTAAFTSSVPSQAQPQLIGFAGVVAPTEIVVAPHSKIQKSAAAKSNPSTLVRSGVRSQPKTKPMMDIARSARPRLLGVSVSNHAQPLAQSVLSRLPSNQPRQASNVELRNLEARKAAPTLIASSEFDETFESVGRLRDDRPEEWGQVVDIYRASLINQHQDDDLDDEEFNDQL